MVTAYREDEVIAALEHIQEEDRSSPHHLDKIVRHVNLLSGEIHAVRFQSVTTQPSKHAPVVRRLIDGDQQQMIEQRSRVFSQPKALQEKIEH